MGNLPGSPMAQGNYLVSEFGVELKSPSGWESTETVAKENDVIGLFFSTSSKFGDGEEFTPSLMEAFMRIKAAGKKMDIIFVSSDKDEAAFNNYFSPMPWKALPFPDRTLQIKLATKFKLNGFRSSLVLIDPKTGKRSANARSRRLLFPLGPNTQAVLGRFQWQLDQWRGPNNTVLWATNRQYLLGDIFHG